jgi:Ser/Thr protein kinase RdoA (MazF antagonist)
MSAPQSLSQKLGMASQPLVQCVAEVLRSFDLGSPADVRQLGGTATPKFAVQVPAGLFVVRARPAEFAGEGFIRFDHESLEHLARAGLPVPRPRRRADGTSWFCTEHGVFEVLSWIEGSPFPEGNRAAISALGSFLARFHSVLRDDIPAGKQGVLREDHPDLLMPYLEQLRGLCRRPEDAAQVEQLARQLDLVRRRLDLDLYPNLPRAVIHGDIHPGNVKFQGANVAAVYDFDYLSLQARCRDLVDALMFFAAERRHALNPDDIRSLTQLFALNLEWAAWLIGGYQQVNQLTDLEWSALPWLIRSQWLQIRLRGSRKVPPEQKLAFVLDGFFELISWLDDEAEDFFGALRSVPGCSPTARGAIPW